MSSSRYPIGKTKKILIEVPLTQGTERQRVKVIGFTKDAIGYRMVGWRCESGIFRPFIDSGGQEVATGVLDSSDDFLYGNGGNVEVDIRLEDRKYSIPQILRILTTHLNTRWVNGTEDGSTGVDLFESHYTRSTGTSVLLARDQSTSPSLFSFFVQQYDHEHTNTDARNPQYILGCLGFPRYGQTGLALTDSVYYTFSDYRQRCPEAFSIYCPQLQERTAGNPLVTTFPTGTAPGSVDSYTTPLVTVIRKEDESNSRTMINESFTDLTHFFTGNTFEFRIESNIPFPSRPHFFDDFGNNTGNRTQFEYPDIYLRFEFLIKQ